MLVALEYELWCPWEWMETPLLAMPTTHYSAKARGQEDTPIHGLASNIAGVSEWWVLLSFWLGKGLR
ncbi:conserved hypothetical protein [Ricinus communis]|uniref:Uncharacterized protein n=1 Tax=Ricinus communis TaxID=3988 RepID=B9REM3_RICCO|nr:conserved hypothetical protein [Ricinus communis]